MQKKIAGLSVLLLSVFSSVAMADDAAALRQKLVGFTGMSANFKQQVTDINHKKIQQGEGVVALAYPDKLYWHLTSPDESMIVADGHDVWMYNPFAEEVTVMGMKDVVAASPIALLVHRDEKTWQDYNITQSGECYKIKPKNIDSQVVGVDVCFKGNTLQAFTILDNQGNNSQFTLKGQRTLAAKDDNLFKFTVPDNVDLDDQRAGE